MAVEIACTMSFRPHHRAHHPHEPTDGRRDTNPNPDMGDAVASTVDAEERSHVPVLPTEPRRDLSPTSVSTSVDLPLVRQMTDRRDATSQAGIVGHQATSDVLDDPSHHDGSRSIASIPHVGPVFDMAAHRTPSVVS